VRPKGKQERGGSDRVELRQEGEGEKFKKIKTKLKLI